MTGRTFFGDSTKVAIISVTTRDYDV